MAALDDAGFVNGTNAYVASFDAPWVLDRNDAGTSDNIVRVTPHSGAGRWVRLLGIASPRWLDVATWYVDTAAGNDENIGGSAGAGNAIKSIAELRRRLPYVKTSITVTLAAGTFPSTDNLQWEPVLIQEQSTLPLIILNGTRTLGADNAVVSSSDESVNAAPLIDLGIALTPGDMLQATSGASNGQTSVVLALIAGTQYRTSPWASNGFSRGTPPIAGANVAVVTALTSFSRLALSCQSNSLIVTNCKFTDFDIRENFNLILRTCILGTGVLSMTSTGALLAQGCSFQCSNISAGSNSTTFKAMLSGFLRTGKAQPTIFLGAGSATQFSNCVLQGGGVDIGGAVGMPGGLLTISRTGIFSASGYALDVRNGAYCDVTDTLYGSGSATGVRARDGGSIAVFAGLTPTLASTGQELTVEASATPATWAIWAAAPYSSNAFEMTKGSRVITRG